MLQITDNVVVVQNFYVQAVIRRAEIPNLKVYVDGEQTISEFAPLAMASSVLSAIEETLSDPKPYVLQLVKLVALVDLELAYAFINAAGRDHVVIKPDKAVQVVSAVSDLTTAAWLKCENRSSVGRDAYLKVFKVERELREL